MTRLTGQDIIDLNIPGPQEDMDGSKVTYFLHANGAAVKRDNPVSSHIPLSIATVPKS